MWLLVFQHKEVWRELAYEDAYELLLRNSNCSLKSRKSLSHNFFFPSVGFLMAQMQSESKFHHGTFTREAIIKDDVISVKVVDSNLSDLQQFACLRKGWKALTDIILHWVLQWCELFKKKSSAVFAFASASFENKQTNKQTTLPPQPKKN